jgi:mannosyltransferase
MNLPTGMRAGSPMNPKVSIDGLRTWQYAAAALVVWTCGIWLRVSALDHESLWLDEVFSAALSHMSMLGTIVGDLHFDVHPPLYYLQLNAWGLLGQGDLWLRLNSVFWSGATMLAVLFATTWRFGARSGLLALLCCALLGSDIFYAQELRMYAMYACLSVLCWHAAERLHADYRLRKAWLLIVLLVILVAVHSAAVIAASAVLLYAFPRPGSDGFRQRLTTWITAGAITVVAAIPWILYARHRTVGHTLQPSWHALIQTTSGWVLGYGNAPLSQTLHVATACLLLLALIGAAVARSGLLRLMVCFIVWPLVFGALVSVLVSPIWLDRTFAFCGPFVAIALGTALAVPDRPFAGPVVAAALVVLVPAGLWLDHLQTVIPSKPDGYREAAAYLHEHVQAGEIVYLPYYSDLWGISRYLIGPDWGNPLQVQDPGEYNGMRDWLQVHLGNDRVHEWRIVPVSRELGGFRVPIFTGGWPLPLNTNGRVVWLADVFRDPLNALPFCIPLEEPARFGRVFVYRLNCTAAASQ